MGKKDKWSKKRKSGREQPHDGEDAITADAFPRLAAEVAGLVYAAKGFDPAGLSSLPPDSPVRTATRYVAWAALLESGLFTVDELQTLSLAEATELAVSRVMPSAAE